MNEKEAEQIAGAISHLRTDWHFNGIKSILADDRLRMKPYADIALVFTALAVDPNSTKPTRIFEAGPWWQVAAPAKPTEHNTSAHIRGVSPTDCDICSQPRHRCELDDSHEYVQRNRPTERASTETINRLRGYVLASNWKSKTTEDEA